MSVTAEELQTLRIRMKPQMWVWWLGIVIFPCFVAGGVAALVGHEWGLAAFALGVGLPLTWVAVTVLRRTLGKTLEIVLDETHLLVPGVIQSTRHFPIASITKITSGETVASGVSFWSMSIAYTDGGKKQAASVTSQVVGKQAFDELADALALRGVSFE